MPGTPATTPRHGAPRYANTDSSDFAGQVNAVTDRFEITAPVFISGLAASRPAAGIADRYHYATDTGELTRDTGTAWVGPLNPRSTPIVSALPGTPFDGQEVRYQSAAMATDGVAWLLRYRAGSANALKWEVLGGSPMYVDDAAGVVAITSAANAYQTTAVSVTAPLAGDYVVRAGAGLNPVTANMVAAAAVFVSGGLNYLARVNSDVSGGGMGDYISVARERRINTIAAAAAVDLRLMRTTTGAANSVDRWLSIMPIRVG